MTKTITVPNIGCAGCVRAITNELKEINGVSAVEGVVETKTVTIEFGDPATWEQIIATLKEIDYAPA